MKKFVPDYIKAKRDMLDYFKCEEDYFLKPVTNCSWHIKELEEMFFISYQEGEDKPNESIIVKKDGKPMVYRQGDYALVICVECVKVGLIFKIENEF